MPGGVHETFLEEVLQDLKQQLTSIAGRRSRPSAEHAQKIKAGRSRRITPRNPEYGSHEPDDQFRYPNTLYPCVVIEISHSQKREMLSHLADDYILGSDGKIRVVICLDIEYRGSKKATLSVWRARIERNNLGEEYLDAVQVVTDQVCL